MVLTRDTTATNPKEHNAGGTRAVASAAAEADASVVATEAAGAKTAAMADSSSLVRVGGGGRLLEGGSTCRPR